jgi:hypothetical protein
MYPSIKTLMQIKDVTREDAIAIRAIMASGPGRDANGLTRMQRIDRVLQTHGVEYTPAGRNAKSPAIYYCNAGDTYACTVLKVRGRFRVGCWGDLVERGNYA